MRVLRVGSIATVGLAVSAAAAAVAIGQAGPDKAAGLKAAVDISKPKNIILFIGDGMGDSEVTSGRYYAKGATGRLNMDALPFRGDVTTYNVGPAAAPPYPPNYVPDSAPTAAAWSIGHQDARRAPRPGPELRRDRPGHELRDLHGDRQAARSLDGQRLHRGDHGRDAGRPVRPHLPARLPGPERHAQPRARRRPRPRAGSARSPSSRPTTSSTWSSAAAAPATRSRSTAGGTKNVIDYAVQDKGYKYVATEAELNAVTALAPGERAARPVPRLEHDDRVPAADRLRHRRRLGRRRSASRPTAATSRRWPR